MEQDRKWQLELEQYIKQGEPERAEKSAAWQNAIGLQAVDGLITSPYLMETASFRRQNYRVYTDACLKVSLNMPAGFGLIISRRRNGC